MSHHELSTQTTIKSWYNVAYAGLGQWHDINNVDRHLLPRALHSRQFHDKYLGQIRTMCSLIHINTQMTTNVLTLLQTRFLQLY